jgi:hypothetical protein
MLGSMFTAVKVLPQKVETFLAVSTRTVLRIKYSSIQPAIEYSSDGRSADGSRTYVLYTSNSTNFRHLERTKTARRERPRLPQRIVYKQQGAAPSCCQRYQHHGGNLAVEA